MSAYKVPLAGLGMAVLLAYLTPGAWGQAAPTPLVAPFANLNALTRIKGSVVCVGCSLEEARKGQSASGHLYELQRAQSKAVLRVDWVEDASRWTSITQGHQLEVRAAAPVWQQLTAEENLFQEVEITGVLSSTRTLDVGQVTAIASAPPAAAGPGEGSDYWGLRHFLGKMFR